MDYFIFILSPPFVYCQVAAVVANIKEEPSVKIEDQTDTKTGSIVLHSTSEFCRALGDIPTYGEFQEPFYVLNDNWANPDVN